MDIGYEEKLMEQVKEEEDDDDDDAKYRLTEYFILYLVLKEYGIAVGEWYPTLWNHIYDDFMKRLEKAGYIEKAMEEG